MNDDEMDRRSKSDGHCFGIMESLTNCIKRVAQGNMGKNARVMQALRAASIRDDAFQARDAMRQGMVLEGTGTIEPRILPLDESYGQKKGGHDTIKLRNKKLAERAFVKALYAHMQTLKDLDKKDGGTRSTMSNLFNAEGMPHYVKEQHPQRRPSDFYKQPVMACCNELYQRFGIIASQFAFTQSTGGGELKYGVRIADFLRNTEGYPLVFPFADCTQEWQQQVDQLTECVQHQLPLMAFGRYTDEQYEKETHSRYMGGSAPDQKSFEQLVHQVASDPTLTVARLQSRPWKLDSDPTKTRELYDMLGNKSIAPGVLAYAFYSEHQLPICGPTVEILVVGKVDAWLGLQQPGSL
jgi:hypothetical protein